MLTSEERTCSIGCIHRLILYNVPCCFSFIIRFCYVYDNCSFVSLITLVEIYSTLCNVLLDRCCLLFCLHYILNPFVIQVFFFVLL